MLKQGMSHTRQGTWLLTERTFLGVEIAGETVSQGWFGVIKKKWVRLYDNGGGKRAVPYLLDKR